MDPIDLMICPLTETGIPDFTRLREVTIDLNRAVAGFRVAIDDSDTECPLFYPFAALAYEGQLLFVPWGVETQPDDAMSALDTFIEVFGTLHTRATPR